MRFRRLIWWNTFINIFWVCDLTTFCTETQLFYLKKLQREFSSDQMTNFVKFHIVQDFKLERIRSDFWCFHYINILCACDLLPSYPETIFYYCKKLKGYFSRDQLTNFVKLKITEDSKLERFRRLIWWITFINIF